MADTDNVDTGDLIDKLGVTPQALMGAQQKASDEYNASYSDLLSAIGLGQQAAQKQQQGINQEAGATAVINTIQGAADAKTTADNRGAAAHFGTNPDASSYVLASMGDSILQEEQDIADRRDMINDKVNTGFLDNPIQWMLNQATLPMDVYAANLKINDVNQKLDVIHSLEQATHEQMATNAAIDQGDAIKVAAAKNTALAAKAIQAVASSQMEVARLGMQGTTLKEAFTKDQLNSLFQVNTAIGERERLTISEEEAPYYIELAKERAESFRQSVLAREQTEADKAAMNAKLGKAAQMLGIQSAPSVDDYRRMPEKERGFWDEAVVGVDFDKLPGAIQGPATAMNLANTINAPLTPGMNDTRVKIGKLVDTARADPRYLGLTKPDEKEAFENAVVRLKANEQLTNVPKNGSIYSPLSLRAMITTSPALNDNPIAKELSVLATDPSYAADPNDSFKAAMKLVGSGTLTPPQAGQAVAQLYQAMQMQLNQVHQYSKMGLQPLDPITGYRQSLYSGFGYSQSSVVDMSNTAAVTNAITRSIINYRAALSAGGAAIIPLKDKDTSGGGVGP